MGEQELKEVLEIFAKARAVNTASPEKAREVLRKEGVIDDKGELTAPYIRRRADNPAAA